MKNHALAVFHRPPANLNCAQAVLDAFQSVTGRHLAPVADFKLFGGGRAPGGECGALYAACRAAPEAAEQLRTAFADRTGSTLCKTLKKELRFPCADCVDAAADLLAATTSP